MKKLFILSSLFSLLFLFAPKISAQESLQNTPELFKVKVSPIPTTGPLNVELHFAKQGKLSIVLFDIAGNLINSDELLVETTSLSLQGGLSVANGIYLLTFHFKTADGQSQKQSIKVEKI